ncbi:RNA 2',3'-cyclic phosphodiesterase [Virgibacillus sp. W0181]|uniref:RNA 2',3'-cyclic phosphodiesterase n=1 Tax=Virgibacillus sp. W0181 TaxID=3391581 RepID=UPI003F4459FD
MTAVAHYFIAIPLPLSLKSFLANWQDVLQEECNYRKWTYKHDLHITLKFLGAVEKDEIENVQKELRKLTNLPSFSTTAGSIGAFGKLTKPRVLWAGVEKTEQMEALYEQVETRVAALGFAKDTRPFRPHITLAKQWDGPVIPDRLTEMKKQYQNIQYELHVKEIVLYQIYPKHTPKYEVVEQYPLVGS